MKEFKNAKHNKLVRMTKDGKKRMKMSSIGEEKDEDGKNPR